MSDSVNFPPGFGLQNLVAWGNSGLIVLDTESNTVIKSPHDEECFSSIAREQQIYERFAERGGHEGILQYCGTFDAGIRLEFAPNNNLRSYLEKNGADIGQKRRWAIQIANALDFAHRSGVIHGDLTWHNILLDHSLNVKLADFAGSSLDGSEFLIAVTPSHRYPPGVPYLSRGTFSPLDLFCINYGVESCLIMGFPRMKFVLVTQKGYSLRPSP